METIPDIFYPLVEVQGDNIELRYSLRSLANTDHGEVFIIGHKPSWVQGVTHIPFEDKAGGKYKNVVQKEIIACYRSQARDLVIMHDDVFILKKTPIGFYIRNQSVKDTIEAAKLSGRPPRVVRALRNIQKLFKQPVTAFVHVPHRINRQKNIRLQSKYDLLKKPFLTCDVYANEYKNDHPWEPIEDCKIYGDPGEIIQYTDRLFVSTSDRVARHKDFEAIISKLFPNKSKYEK